MTTKFMKLRRVLKRKAEIKIHDPGNNEVGTKK